MIPEATIETVSFKIPKHYLPKIMYILQSGILDTKGDKVEIHFDHNGTIRKIYGPRFSVDEMK